MLPKSVTIEESGSTIFKNWVKSFIDKTLHSLFKSHAYYSQLTTTQEQQHQQQQHCNDELHIS